MYLRELKDIDARWDTELIRGRFDTGKSQVAPRDFAEALRRALQGLAKDGAGSPAIATALDPLRAAFEEKAAMVEKYKTQSAALKEALGGVVAAMSEVQAMVKGARLADPRQRDRFVALENNLNEIQAEVLKFNLLPDDKQRARVESAMAALRMAEGAYPQPLGSAVARLNGQGETVLREKPAENELFTRI